MCYVYVGINIIVDLLEEVVKEEEDVYFFWNFEMKGFMIIVILMIIYVLIIYFCLYVDFNER